MRKALLFWNWTEAKLETSQTPYTISTEKTCRSPSRSLKFGKLWGMKRILLLCLATALNTPAQSLFFDNEDNIESGKEFNYQLSIPVKKLPENRSNLTLETDNGFKLIGIDSTDEIRQGFFGPSYKVRIYNFKLKAPKKTGQLNAGQIYLTINGQKREITENGVPVFIRRSLKDPALSLSQTPNKKTVYVGEQFYINLSFYFYENFRGNLQATELNTGDDFIVYRNDVQIKPERVDNNPYESKANIRYAWLSPTKSGDLTIPPVKFKYTKQGELKTVTEKKKILGGYSTFTTSTQEPVDEEAQSAPVNITVLPLPTEGKPADFSGMVGNYSFSANFDRTNLKVGEALTLAINIKGDGTPGTITDPKLPDFSEFRSVPPENSINKNAKGAKVITSKNIKVFLYPKKKGTFEIPAITYSWFNPAKKKYETASAGPWTIEVEKSEAPAEPIYQPSAPTGTSTPAVQKQEIEFLGSDIRFIHPITDKSETAAPHRNVLFWIWFIAAIPFYLIVNFAITRKRKRDSNTALVRKDKASKLLKEKFEKAREALHSGDGKAFYAALENGLIDYLSNLTNVEFKGMTRPQMKQELEKRGVNSDTINAIDSWLEKCAFVRFAPVTASTEEQSQMLADVEKLCKELKL